MLSRMGKTTEYETLLLCTSRNAVRWPHCTPISFFSFLFSLFAPASLLYLQAHKVGLGWFWGVSFFACTPPHCVPMSQNVHGLWRPGRWKQRERKVEKRQEGERRKQTTPEHSTDLSFSEAACSYGVHEHTDRIEYGDRQWQREVEEGRTVRTLLFWQFVLRSCMMQQLSWEWRGSKSKEGKAGAGIFCGQLRFVAQALGTYFC